MGTQKGPLGLAWRKGPLKPQQRLPALGTQAQHGWTHGGGTAQGAETQWPKVEGHILRLPLESSPPCCPRHLPLQVP